MPAALSGGGSVAITGAGTAVLAFTIVCMLRWYAYGLGANDALNQMNVSANTRATLIPDIQGSFVATLDSSGVLTKSGYQPYGQSASVAGTFAYTGQRLDIETSGLY